MDERSLWESYLNQFREENGIPGVQLAMKNAEGIVLTADVGFADVKSTVPLDSDHRMMVGSATKMFTAVLVLQAVESGTISLSSTIDHWYPNYPGADSITIEMLLTHRSGLKEVLSVPSFLMTSGLNRHKEWDSGTVLKKMARKKYRAEPGSDFSYCNTNYLILGGILEQIDGRDLAVMMRDDLFRPLGMLHTSLDPMPPDSETMPAEGIDKDYMPFGPHSIPGHHLSWTTLAWAAGGARSTAGDLLKWCEALYRSDLISPFVGDRLMRISDAGGLEDLGIQGYGMGLAEVHRGGEVWLGHQGAIMGFEASPLYRDTDGAVIVILINASQRDSPLPELFDKLAGSL